MQSQYYIFKVYVLKCPLSNEVRYVGQTVKLLSRRYSYHINDKDRTYKTNWINSLKKQGLLPIIELLEICQSKKMLNEREKYYIKHFKNIGYKLTNTTDGGGGSLGLTPMKGKKHSLETRLKMSIAQKGKVFSEESRQKIRETLTGRHDCAETRLKKSKSRIGLKHSEETKRKMSKSLLGNKRWLGKKHKPETKRKMSKNNRNNGRIKSNALPELPLQW